MRVLSHVLVGLVALWGGVVIGLYLRKTPRRRITFMLQASIKPNSLVRFSPTNIKVNGVVTDVPLDNFDFTLADMTGNFGSVVKDGEGFGIQTGDAGATATLKGSVTFDGASGSAEVSLNLSEDGEITFDISFDSEAESDVPPAPPGD